MLRFVAGEAPPAVVVYVDAWTRLGGSQFVDSPGTGRYAHLPLRGGRAVRGRCVPDPGRCAAHRGLAGHSSGGYGAMVNAMLRPDLFGAFASHAGDGLFELGYRPEFGPAVKALRDHYGGSLAAFWEDFRARPGRSRGGDGSAAEPVLHGRLLVSRCRRHGAAPLRPRDRRARSRRSGTDGWRPTRFAWRAPTARRCARCVPSGWMPAAATSTVWTWPRPPSIGSCWPPGVAEDRIHFELFEGGHTNAALAVPAGPGLAGRAARLAAAVGSGGDDQRVGPAEQESLTQGRRPAAPGRGAPARSRSPRRSARSRTAAAKWTMPATKASRAGSRWTLRTSWMSSFTICGRSSAMCRNEAKPAPASSTAIRAFGRWRRSSRRAAP